MEKYKVSIGRYQLLLDPEAEGTTIIQKVDNFILSRVRSQKTIIVEYIACLFVKASVFQRTCRYEKAGIGTIPVITGIWVQVRMGDTRNIDVCCCGDDLYFVRLRACLSRSVFTICTVYFIWLFTTALKIFARECLCFATKRLPQAPRLLPVLQYNILQISQQSESTFGSKSEANVLQSKCTTPEFHLLQHMVFQGTIFSKQYVLGCKISIYILSCATYNKAALYSLMLHYNCSF